MNDALKKWVLVTCLLIVIVSVTNFAWRPLPLLSYLIVVGFGIFTYFLHTWTLKAEQKGPNPFVRAFMVATFVKLLVVLGFLSIYFYLKGSNKTEIAIVTMICYAVFLVVGARELQSKLKASQSKSKK